MTPGEARELEQWLAVHVTKTLRVRSESEYQAEVKLCAAVNKNPHPNLMLTQPSRFAGHVPRYTTDRAAAMIVFDLCVQHLARLTGRTDFQIVTLYDHGNIEPYIVTTDSTYEEDDSAHVENCATGETLAIAFCRFAQILFSKNEKADLPG